MPTPEAREGRMTDSVKTLLSTIHADLKESQRERLDRVEAHLLTLIAAQDERQSQRNEAQERAVTAALIASDKAAAAAFHAAERQVATSLSASDKAIVKAEEAQAHHNAGQNEWRATVTDLTQTMSERSRREMETAVDALVARADVRNQATTDKIDLIQTRLDRAEGRGQGLAAHISTIIAIIAVTTSVGGLVLALTNSSRQSSPGPTRSSFVPTFSD